MPDYEGAIPLPADAVLPDALAAELGDARGRGEIWSAYVDGEPAAFAYAPWRSERWFDVSVDVIPGARQLGLGTIVAAAMIRHERAAGREPVWGADEDNHASLRLAARLGFVECDRIWVAP
jgi:L-amino acid N-acyltransferase YncA